MGYVTESVRATWLVFRMHLATIAGSRRTLAGIVLAAIPPLLATLAARFAPSDATGGEIFAALGVLLLVQFVVPMLGVSLGVGAIADEAESRTITYPFTRPIPRASFFLGRWFATLVNVLGLIAASGIGLAIASSMRASPPDSEMVRSVLGAALLGGTIYSLGAAVIGILARRGLIIALGYAFAIEGLLANVPGSTQKMTVQYHLRSIFVEKDVDPWQSMDIFELSSFLPPTEALVRMAVVGALLLAFGTWAVTRKQFVLAS
ncbi:MAG: ABC transporter permease subunit [Planctomycetota bacterium]